MRLKSSIFLWVSLATIIPLSALVLGITAYSEHLYSRSVDSSLESSMTNIVSELEFRLNFEREVILSLASSPAMQRFIPTLAAASNGDLLPNYFEEVDKLNEFLEGFQQSVPGLDTVRVLDLDGNTLVKVRFGKHLPPLYESMDDVPFAEEELLDPNFLSWIRQLTPGKLVYGQLPLNRKDLPANREIALLNSIVPLANNKGTLIGFLSARALGDQLDHIIKSLPRSFKYNLSIAELNQSDQQRHGMLLYSDEDAIIFNQEHDPTVRLNKYLEGDVWHALEKNRFGSYVSSHNDRRYFYQEFYPYSNQLVSWVVVLTLDNNEITAPFHRIRLGLLAFAFAALGISLILANLGARHIAEPITQFSRSLKQYADGETPLPGSEPAGADELKQLDQSFHYLVEALENTEQERNRVQGMLLQNAKLASIGEMAAGIGHEINNPLNNILSYTKLIERQIEKDNPELQNDIDGLRNEALRAGSIVKGILNFARQLPPEYIQFDLVTWLRDTIHLVEPELKKRHVTIQLDDIPERVMEGDRNQLQQVMINLLMNAIQASESGNSIEIQVSTWHDDQLEICISDQGTGIEEENLNKAFDPFFTTKDIGEGSGLGLSISLGIVQYHGGELTLRNNSRGGMDAILHLPLSIQEHEEVSDEKNIEQHDD